jgi:C1A family cysteine protease
LVLLLAVSSFGARNYQQEFVDFMHKHEKSYAHDEFYHRFAVFKANLDKIDAHNAKNLSWTLGVNKFADLTSAEFKAIYNGYKAPTIRAIHGVKLSNANVPSSIDWAAKGATTDVKDQGQCGSCWSFSTTGALEGLFYLKHSNSLSPVEPDGTGDWTTEGFSEQMLVDCSQSAGNQGCEGGLMDDAFSWVGTNGIDLEANYKYTAQDGSCQESSGKYMVGISFTDVTPNDEDALQAAVAQQPVSVAIEADQSVFQLYSGGVINDDSCGTQLDHGVLAVGYGHDSSSNLDFWKVKNSWGASWGENGFVRLARGSGSGNPGMCGIAMQPSYPTEN